jgi:hypothetical protein
VLPEVLLIILQTIQSIQQAIQEAENNSGIKLKML